jgi:uncharacterized protein YjbI with pentapeptide repeats
MEANLEGVVLNSAFCRYCNLVGTKIERANLSDIDLSYANLSSSSIRSSILTEAIMIGVKFIGANLDRSFFKSTNLSFARFDKSIIEENVFNKANLKSVNFSGVSIKNNSFEKVIGLTQAEIERLTQPEKVDESNEPIEQKEKQ